jgi:hypothetical protein
MGISSQSRTGQRSKEIQEMYMNFAAIAFNTVKMKKWLVRGRSSGDVRFYEQIESVKRYGAMLLLHEDKCLYDFLEGQSVQCASVGDLIKSGFQCVAGPSTPWTAAEVQLLNQSLEDVKNDPTIVGNYLKLERYIAWSTLGGSRTEAAVLKKMRELLPLMPGTILIMWCRQMQG